MIGGRLNRTVVKKFCDVSCSLKKRKLYQKSKDDKVEFTLGVKIGSASLDFFVKFCNGQVAHCQQKYVHVDEVGTLGSVRGCSDDST